MEEEIIILIMGVLVLGVPVLALSARFALRPIVESIIRLRESFQPTGGVGQERRLEAIEAELALIRSQLDRLEGTAFVKELQRGQADER